MSVDYTPDGDTLRRFMQSPAFVRGLQGPIGSGKSVACVIEMLRLALAQEPAIDVRTGERTGPRKVRSGVIRNTTPQLETTTMKTWLEWLPENDFGKVRWRAPFRQDIRIPEIDLEWEVWFLALDRDEDVRKLLSFEFTNIWMNEARELSRQIVSAAISRVSRYPRMIEGGPTRPCIIMDTNAPDEEHWWAIMSGQAEAPDWMSNEDRLTLLKPDNWEFFTQPPGVLDRLSPQGELLGYELNPDRENAKFTDQDYYTRLLQGQTRGWIQNMLQNKIGRIFAGRAVYQGFLEKTHVAPEDIEVDPAHPIHIGVDFGTTPAAAFGQDIRGQVRVIDELVTRDTHAVQFAEELLKKIREQYADRRIILTGDPAGQNASGVDDMTPFKVFKAAGLDIQPAWTNDPVIRIAAVETQMNTMVEGLPAYQVSPACSFIVNAKKGGYCFLKDREEIDKKSIFSHVSDAEQYMFLRMGYGKKLIGRGQRQKLQTQANMKQNVFDRSGRGRGLTARQRSRQSILSRGR